ncbi:DUF6438 domain-containing protein [Pseudoduganella sp. GCM10020061]|uniref:DUF6438 domain-containing protein n=1 Tax=Pseudoduganella sp. GCM10020061 TaxID=3317345 RepID=UPI003643EB58
MRTLAWMMIVACLSACSDPGPRGRTAPQPFTEFAVLTAEQSACLFDCPAFEVKVFSDGRVLHSGPTFEHSGGPHESRIDRRGLESIAQALRDVRFYEMRDRYVEGDGCKGTVTDMSTLSFSVSRGGGHDKSVVFYSGCIDPTAPIDRINALIKAIDRVTGTTSLLEQRKKLVPKECLYGCES